MQVVQARAYAFADTFRLRDLVPLFAPGEVKLLKDELVAQFPDGTAVAHDFGAVVFFGCEVERDRVIAAIRKLLPHEPHPPLTEELAIRIDPAASPPVSASFDQVTLRDLSLPSMQVIALLLAQSAAMDYYEEDVAEILTQNERITFDLQTRGRMRGQVKDLIRFIGTCIVTKNGIIETVALFDKPESTWEAEELDKLYVRLREVLEIEDRFRNLEYKLRMIQENLVLLVDLSRQRHTIYLETTVLLLIAFEIVVMVWQGLRGVH